MNDVREVKLYGWWCFVSNHLLRYERSWIERSLQQELEGKVRKAGHTPLPDTFTIRFQDAADPGWPDDPKWETCRQNDSSVAFMTVRCYET